MARLSHRALLKGLGIAIVSPFVAVLVFGVAIEWLALALWLVPVLVGGWYHGRHGDEEAWLGRTSLSLGAALTAPWTALLHAIGPSLPRLGRVLVGLPAAPDGRVVEAGIDGTPYVLVALITAIGIAGLLFFVGIEWHGRDQRKPEAERRRALGRTVLAQAILLVLVTRFAGFPVLAWYLAALGAFLSLVAFSQDPVLLRLEGAMGRERRRRKRDAEARTAQ